MGYFAWIPFVILAVGTLLGGIIPKWFITKWGWSLNRSRKSVMLFASLLVPVCCVSLFYASGLGVALISIAGVMLGHVLWGHITIPAAVFHLHGNATYTGSCMMCGRK